MNRPLPGRLPNAIAEIVGLLHRDPALAETRARELLKAAPDHPAGRMLLAAALRIQGDAAAALALVEPLAAQNPGLAGAQYELALALAAVGRGPEAASILTQLLQAVPNLPGAWRALGDIQFGAGGTRAAADAYQHHMDSPVFEPAVQEAFDAWKAGDLPHARNLLQDHLRLQPADVVALRALGGIATLLGELDLAEVSYRRCLERMPGYTKARHEFAVLLRRLQKPEETVQQLDILLHDDPENLEFIKLKASALAHIGEYDQAIALYSRALDKEPGDAAVWSFRAHFLRARGDLDEAIAGYRKSIALRPEHGDAYWSLANLKTFRFTPEEIGAMRAQLARRDLADADRVPMTFALGSALESLGAYEEAFRAYSEGNAIWKATVVQDVDTTKVPRLKKLLTPAFFHERAGTGNPAADPIFVLGMPRAGSTLVEQILSSHSSVEGTMELLEILSFVERLGGIPRPNRPSAYPESLAALTPAALRALGDEYLERTRVHRKHGRLHFIDKTPNNFQHIGLIHLILPNAKIVDVRRHPLSCCFSNFKQHFAQGQNFAYGLTDLGQFYRRYVELMAHHDAVLPGKVHRVFYEQLVDDPEREVRRLLDHCGLPFEESCLKFYENERPVLTPSSEQVRQPIYRSGLEQWKHFEPWLGPLKAALGDVLDLYPAIPKF